MKTSLMSQAFMAPNQHILSFVCDTHSPPPWNTGASAHTLFAEIKRKANTEARLPVSRTSAL